MPKTVVPYEKDGIHLSHYSTWEISKDAPIADKPDVRSIQIHGPHDSVLLMICQPPGTSQTLDEFASAVAQKRVSLLEDKLKLGPIKAAQVTIGTSVPASAKIGGTMRTGIGQHFEIDILGQPVPHDAEFYLLENDRYHIMLMTQVASQYKERIRPDWQLMMDTLVVDGRTPPAPSN